MERRRQHAGLRVPRAQLTPHCFQMPALRSSKQTDADCALVYRFSYPASIGPAAESNRYCFAVRCLGVASTSICGENFADLFVFLTAFFKCALGRFEIVEPALKRFVVCRIALCTIGTCVVTVGIVPRKRVIPDVAVLVQ